MSESYTITLKFEDGTTKKLHACPGIPKVLVDGPCENCYGQGELVYWNSRATCPDCKGLGTVEVEL
jgi:DnaJ-class molecular chaperone